MNLKHRQNFYIFALLVTIAATPPISGQSQFVDPQMARQCGCTLRKWPWLDDVVTRTLPSLAMFQPEVFLPHFVDAGRGNSPRLPTGGVYGDVRYSTLATLDLFVNHDWHDFLFFVKLDGQGYSLNSATNAKNSNSFLCYNSDNRACSSIRGETLMEMEWDTRHYPERFWATAGDRVWMTGRYVWDCGHPPTYHTEIHPPKAVAFTRQEQYVFPGDNSPSLTNKTYVYVHGRSGVKNYDFKTVAGVESVVFNGYKDASVATENYEFDIPLPPKPAGYRGHADAEVIELPFGGPAPTLTVNAAETAVRVRYPLSLGDPNPERKFAAVIVSGWRAPVSSVRFRRLNVNIEQLQILKPHNAVSSSEWKLWLNINGQWTSFPTVTAKNELPLNLDRLLNVDGLMGKRMAPIPINRQFEVIVPETDDARLTIQIAGWVNFYDELFGAREDIVGATLRLPSMLPQTLSAVSSFEGRIGSFFKQFSRSENFGVGPHREALSKAHELVEGKLKHPGETQGDFTLSYTIREISK